MGPYQKYLSLAKNQYPLNTINDDTLLNEIPFLPQLDEEELITLSKEAEKFAFSCPKLEWLITHISRRAIEAQKPDLWLLSLAFWFEARASNHWLRPLQSKIAAKKAREGFLQLGRREWAAASIWQYYENPRYKGHLGQAEKKLIEAQSVLDNSDLQEYAAHCRLTLAAIQIPLRRFDEALNNIQKSRDYFTRQKDLPGQTQCQLAEGDLLGIKRYYFESNQTIEKANLFFVERGFTSATANCYKRLGLNLLFGTTNIDQAIEYFKKADELFQKCDLELNQAFCQTYIGVARLQKGDLESIEEPFKMAQNIYRRHHAFQYLADNAVTYGLFCMSKGEPQKTIFYFKKAKKYHSRLGIENELTNDDLNLGKAYRIAGRYQDALLILEEGRERALKENDSLQIAYAEAQMAFIWYRLKDYSKSMEFLERSISLHEQNRQNATLTTLNNLKARIFTDRKEYNKALECLKNSLDRCIQYSLPPQAALSKRLIGELLTKLNDWGNARIYLEEAESEFTRMDMMLELAFCKQSLALLSLSQNDLPGAEENFQQALNISSGIFDEIDWQAKAGLGRLAKMKSQFEEALALDLEALHSFQRIRDNFWQSSLSGTYSQDSSSFFKEAILNAFSLNDCTNEIKFMEADKANSLIQQFKLEAAPANNKTSVVLEKIKEEIFWLQEKLNSSMGQNAFQNAIQNRQIRQKLIAKSKEYEEVNSRLERQNYTRNDFLKSSHVTAEKLRETFFQEMGNSWLALDYYAADNRIFLIALSPQVDKSFSFPLTARIDQALESLKQNQVRGCPPEKSDLKALGNALLPSSFMETLTPETRMIISPHGKLHGLPWNALIPNPEERFLVEECIPTIINSLQISAILWNSKKKGDSSSRQKGLVVGVSNFDGRFPPLPFIDQEIDTLRPLLNDKSFILTEKNATWKNISALNCSNSFKGLSYFSFLHIASHFFSDSISGRLSGLSLHREEIYQSQLRELAPLPELVTLSGCNSLFSLNFAGDEPVGLPGTCLASGAKNIIGSYQPVKDEASSRFMPAFYRNYFSGLSPAQALAQTQRELISHSSELSSWIGYLCFGIG